MIDRKRGGRGCLSRFGTKLLVEEAVHVPQRITKGIEKTPFRAVATAAVEGRV
jgi:hypothetical protein